MTPLLAPELRAAIAGAQRAVVFTGAGVSAESGLGTFRGADGLWEKFRPEDLATPQAFARDPARVTRWYLERFAAMRRAEPNPAHRAIASWERLFPSLLVVTQNIDRLHQRAGSHDVVELHGTLWTWLCERCRRQRPAEGLPAGGDAPLSCECGGRLRPGVVWFGEALPQEAFARAAEASAWADLFVVVGTSGTVWPAAGLVEIARRGGALVLEVNREQTPLSELAALAIAGDAGTILPQLTREIAAWRSPA
jgi:NAD-dependent deacetylase